MLAMFAGAEVVHRYYRPDLVSNLEVIVLINRKHLSQQLVEKAAGPQLCCT
uniref:Uncharacterized protein n=1 Tax=Zonotrichia albicollis TaxID=44394 RepID=A0A8D2M440_ZONAL